MLVIDVSEQLILIRWSFEKLFTDVGQRRKKEREFYDSFERRSDGLRKHSSNLT